MQKVSMALSGISMQFVMGDIEMTAADFIVATLNQYRNLSDTVIKEMFNTMDKDKDGWITAADAYQALNQKIHMKEEELAKLFRKYLVKRHRRVGNDNIETRAHHAMVWHLHAAQGAARAQQVDGKHSLSSVASKSPSVFRWSAGSVACCGA
jgi:arginyl-tRNA--protein-N-Asp/Glu arginylyltransferase